MTGWSEQRRMAHHASVRKEYYDGLGVDPNTCTMYVVTADQVPAPPEPDVEARLPPPTLVMDTMSYRRSTFRLLRVAKKYQKRLH